MDRTSRLLDNWTRQQTIDLIDIYERYDLLYKTFHVDHGKPAVRQKCYEEIAEKLQSSRPGVTVNAVKLKTKTLYQQLFKERDRMLRFIKDGGKRENFKPSLWSYERLQFLLRAKAESDRYDREQQGVKDMILANNGITCREKENSQDEMTFPEHLYETQDSVGSESSFNQDKRSYDEPTLYRKPVEDEFHFFAMNVESQLKDLPLAQALELQEKITSLLVRKRLELL